MGKAAFRTTSKQIEAQQASVQQAGMAAVFPNNGDIPAKMNTFYSTNSTQGGIRIKK